MKLIRALLLSAGVLLSVANASHAQTSISLRAGYNLNTFRGSENPDFVSGYHAGVVLRYPALSFLTARVEALYMQQGARLVDYSVVSFLDHRDARVEFHNVQVPVLAELGIPALNESRIQPRLIVGAFYSYTISAREVYNSHLRAGGPSVVYKSSSDFAPYINRHQYGFIGAMAADIKVAATPVSIEFRYQYNYNEVNQSGTPSLSNLRPTHEEWGNTLYLGTLSLSLTATLVNF